MAGWPDVCNSAVGGRDGERISVGGWLVGRQADVDERISKPHE